MTRRAAVACLAVLAVALAGCSAYPHAVDGDRAKKAIRIGEAATVVARYDEGRVEALTTGKPNALEAVAADAALAIDGVQARPAQLAAPSQVLAGEFRSYPMWFLAICEVPDEGTVAAAVFTRESSRDPWRLAAAPRLAANTPMPTVRVSGGVADTVVGDRPDGLPVALDQLAAHYADVLADPASTYADEFEVDSFITQMREYVEAQPTDVGFEQSWRAATVRYALRLEGGGALVFVDLVRTERYDVRGGDALRFEGTEAGRFLSKPIRTRARLTYYHQVLLQLPSTGDPFALGQYGALVAATGR